MRIDRTSRPRGAAPTKKPARPAEGGEFEQMVEQAAGPQAAEAPTSVADVGVLLAVQAAGQEGRRAAARWGHAALDALREAQIGLLSGDTATGAQALRDAAGAARTRTDDAGLEAALDAIDLRAAVELAKARRMR